MERQGRETLEARIGIAYAFAAATSILFVSADPYGEAEMTSLLKGDIVTTAIQRRHQLLAVVITLAEVRALLFGLERDQRGRAGRQRPTVIGRAAGKAEKRCGEKQCGKKFHRDGFKTSQGPACRLPAQAEAFRCR
jgi:hypothetical protein